MPLPSETMLGPGGRTLIPESESKQLRKALGYLLHVDANDVGKDNANRIACAVEILSKLEQQVREGYHQNPHRGFLAGTAVGRIGKDVHDVRYTHDFDGQNYEHVFNGDVQAYAVIRNGKRDILFTHRRGLPLWDEF